MRIEGMRACAAAVQIGLAAGAVADDRVAVC